MSAASAYKKSIGEYCCAGPVIGGNTSTASCRASEALDQLVELHHVGLFYPDSTQAKV